MKRLLFFILASLVTLAVPAQNCDKTNRQVNKSLRQAEKYIVDFHRDSISRYFPIYNVGIKKEYRHIRFKTIPAYSSIEKYIDFDHAYLSCILARSSEGIWSLSGKYCNDDSYCYTRKDFDSLYDYLDAIKPDRVYRLFGIILIEKSGKRYLVRDNNGYQPCDLGDVMDDVDIFNTFDIPSSPKHKLYIAW